MFVFFLTRSFLYIVKLECTRYKEGRQYTEWERQVLFSVPHSPMGLVTNDVNYTQCLFPILLISLSKGIRKNEKGQFKVTVLKKWQFIVFLIENKWNFFHKPHNFKYYIFKILTLRHFFFPFDPLAHLCSVLEASKSCY